MFKVGLKQSMRLLILLLCCLFCSSCTILRTTGKVAKTVGKVTWGTAKVTGKVLKTTGEVALKGAKAVSKGVRTVVYIAKGKQIIPLEKRGNGFYVNVKLNRKAPATFLLDTGASKMQISRSMANRLDINLNKAETVFVSIAGGHIVSAKEVILKEVKVKSVKIKNVEAIVLDYDNQGIEDGLLGMSFLNHFLFQIDIEKAELILQQRVVD